MSRFTSLKRTALSAATVALAATGAVAVGPGAAHASSNFTVRLAPNSARTLFMDVDGSSTASAAHVVQWTLRGDSQIWTFTTIGANYEIVNKHSGKCLETDGVSGDQLFQAPCTGNPGELWNYWTLPPGTLPAGAGSTFVAGDFIYSVTSGLYVDVERSSTSTGAAIIGYPFTRGVNQYFEMLNA